MKLGTSGRGGDRSGHLLTFIQGVQGDDVFCAGLKTCQLVTGSAPWKREPLYKAIWKQNDKSRTFHSPTVQLHTTTFTILLYNLEPQCQEFIFMLFTWNKWSYIVYVQRWKKVLAGLLNISLIMWWITDVFCSFLNTFTSYLLSLTPTMLRTDILKLSSTYFEVSENVFPPLYIKTFSCC